MTFSIQNSATNESDSEQIIVILLFIMNKKHRVQTVQFHSEQMTLMIQLF